jgi:hypothetical protein
MRSSECLKCHTQPLANQSVKGRFWPHHDRLKTSLWEQQRLGVKPRRAWKEAVVRWLAETSEKVTHQEDVRKLRWQQVGSIRCSVVTIWLRQKRQRASCKANPLFYW